MSLLSSSTSSPSTTTMHISSPSLSTSSFTSPFITNTTTNHNDKVENNNNNNTDVNVNDDDDDDENETEYDDEIGTIASDFDFDNDLIDIDTFLAPPFEFPLCFSSSETPTPTPTPNANSTPTADNNDNDNESINEIIDENENHPITKKTKTKQFMIPNDNNNDHNNNNNINTRESPSLPVSSNVTTLAADAFLAERMSQLTAKEREEVYWDVHGISQSTLAVETSSNEYNQRKLQEFQNELQRLVSIDDKYNNHNNNNHNTQEPKSSFPSFFSSWKTTTRPPTTDTTDTATTPSSSSSSSFSTAAYQQALQDNPTYVCNSKFQLAFLRSERFHVERAAVRYMNFFTVKLELFGRSKLTQDIHQVDLQEIDNFEKNNNDDYNNNNNSSLDALYEGYKQVLPLRDRAGRLIFCDMIQLLQYETAKSQMARLRRKFYSAMVAAEDEDIQQKGNILIVYAVDAKTTTPMIFSDRYNLEYHTKMIRLLNSLPLRFEGTHLCHNSYWLWGPQIALYKLLSTIQNALRFRCHYGGHGECLFQLQTFGIPTSVIPISKDGKALIHQNAHIWKQRNEYECQLRNKRQQQQQQQYLQQLCKQNVYNGDSTTHHTMHHQHQEQQDVISQDDWHPDIPLNNFNHHHHHHHETKQQDDTDASHTTDTNDTNTSNDTTDTNILFPSRMDVLLGRGKGYHDHVGNIRFRHLIQENIENYYYCDKKTKNDKTTTNTTTTTSTTTTKVPTTRKQKTQISMNIVQQVLQSGGRFLQQDITGWIPIHDLEQARSKVSHTFRNLKQQSQQQQQVNTKLTTNSSSSSSSSNSGSNNKRSLVGVV